MNSSCQVRCGLIPHCPSASLPHYPRDGVRAVGGWSLEGCFFPSRSTSFLVLKAQLELQQSELERSHLDLQQALFILEPGSGESLL